MNKETEKIKNHRSFYRTLLTTAYSVDTGHKYNTILQVILYISIFDFFVLIILALLCVIWTEQNVMTISETLELFQHTLIGVFYCFIFTVFIFKNKAICSNYNFIQNDFIQWSIRRGVNPNETYEKISQNIKRLLIPIILSASFTVIGPLIGALNDLGRLPLDDHSHFLIFWPKVVDINEFSTYGMMYSLQISASFFMYVSVISVNLGFTVILYELNQQFQMLLKGMNDAFKHRMDEHFQNLFIDCICHHQTIIKFVGDFKSYFKWVVLSEIIIMHGIYAVGIYILVKVDSSLGYQFKIAGILLFNLCPFYFHCHIGEVMLNMHKRLSLHLYSMAWYDMPNKNKQLIVIMFQRTQKDLSLSSALFFNEKASRSLVFKVIRQVYTLKNLLLKI